MNKTLNWSGLLVPILTIVVAALQQAQHVVRDPAGVMILGALAVLANYVVHPTIPAQADAAKTDSGDVK